jgi:peptide/nickel transport system substrate-binding protein
MMRVRHQGDGSGRFLTTVLFVDIVGSTELASRIGDGAWQRLLGRYYAGVRDRLKRFGGRQIDTAGDGLFAAFDVPADAITCALAIRDLAAELGFATRAGLHMGEAQTIEGKVGGIAVHIGARVAGVAGAGEVLVSGTTKELVEGSGLRFEERGEVELKGVPGRWRLYLAQPPLVVDADETNLDAAGHGGRSAAASRPWVGGQSVPGSPLVRALVVAAVAVILVVVGANLLGAKQTTAPNPSSAAIAPASPTAIASVPVGANSLGRLDPATGSVVSDASVGAQPSGIAVASDGSIWVTNTSAGTISRLDPSGSSVVQTIQQVGTDPTGIAISPAAATSGANSVWVADSGSRQVARISPVTNTVVKLYPIGNAPGGLAVDASGQVWIADRLDGALVELDPASGKETSYTIGLTPLDVAFGAGSIWVSDYDKGAVVRIDPTQGSILARVNVGNGASALAASDQAVWVANRLDGTVSRIDPATNSVAAAPSVGGEPTGLGIGPDAVWVAVSSTSELVKIDPASSAVVGRYSLGASPHAVSMSGAQPLFTAWAAPGDHMGGTLRIVTASADNIPASDPSWAGLSLTNDGLLNYRQVGGPDGFQLVPDLATSLPTPSPDGNSYTFTLRQGIHFSDGTTLKASDVLWSVERSVVAERSLLFPDVLDQQALDGCTAAHCDLSKQVVVDDQAGTVTFRLLGPNPYFLYDLVGMYVVPAGTALAQSSIPLPATGPYEFATISADHVVLKRNPDFQVWSPDAQPQGYPDEIDWQTVPTETAALQSVETGTADWIADPLTTAQVDQLETESPGQLNVAPSTRVWTEMMNTTIAPFSSLAVRQALNKVVDRQAVADAYGGGLVTCQAVPPTFAGYEPDCPYTSDPDSSQTWRGPSESIGQAVATIKAAGMFGKPVTIWTSTDQPFKNVQDEFVKLLTELGFKVTSKTMSDDRFFGGDPASPVTSAAAARSAEMAGFWFYSSVPSAAQTFPGVYTCPGFSSFDDRYPQQLCDRTVDANVRLALEDEQSGDPGQRALANDLWAKIDQEVVNDAPAVFAFNPWDVDFFSARVGHFQHQPVLNVLLDQLWVQ